MLYPYRLNAKKELAMLAQEWKGQDPTGWWVSEKYDGLRALWDGEKFVSRTGKSVWRPPAWFTEGLPEKVALDGELWVGRGGFESASSVVRRAGSGNEWKKVKYMVFDMPNSTEPFEVVQRKLKNWWKLEKPAYAEVVPQRTVQGEAHLIKLLDEADDAGAEGLMLREPGSRYSRTRSHSLLKVKKAQTMDGTVIGHTAGKGRHLGRLGAMVVRLDDGVEFQVGGGLSDSDRDNPPPIGSIIEFSYLGKTKNDVPKFASYIRIRSDLMAERPRKARKPKAAPKRKTMARKTTPRGISGLAEFRTPEKKHDATTRYYMEHRKEWPILRGWKWGALRMGPGKSGRVYTAPDGLRVEVKEDFPGEYSIEIWIPAQDARVNLAQNLSWQEMIPALARIWRRAEGPDLRLGDVDAGERAFETPKAVEKIMDKLRSDEAKLRWEIEDREAFRDRSSPRKGSRLAATYARIQRFGGHGPFLYDGHRFWRDYKGRGWWVILEDEPGEAIKIYGRSPSSVRTPFTPEEAKSVLDDVHVVLEEMEDVERMEAARKPKKKKKTAPKRAAPKRAAPKRKAAGKWSVKKEGRTYSVYRGSDLYKTGLPKIAADAIVKAKTQLGQ